MLLMVAAMPFALAQTPLAATNIATTTDVTARAQASMDRCAMLSTAAEQRSCEHRIKTANEVATRQQITANVGDAQTLEARKQASMDARMEHERALAARLAVSADVRAEHSAAVQRHNAALDERRPTEPQDRTIFYNAGLSQSYRQLVASSQRLAMTVDALPGRIAYKADMGYDVSAIERNHADASAHLARAKMYLSQTSDAMQSRMSPQENREMAYALREARMELHSATRATRAAIYAYQHAPMMGDSSDVTGDLNNDGAVDEADLLILLGHWGPVDNSVAVSVAADLNNDGVVNVQDLQILLAQMSNNPAVADLNGDGVVNVSDMLILLAAWGECGDECPADLNGDGVVDSVDLEILLGFWGEV